MATANSSSVFKTIIQTMAVTAAVALAGCATTQPQASDGSKQASTATSDAPAQAAEAEVVDTFEGDGMEIPLDGSSLQAFEASMARVKRHADESSYTTLENAIEYLLVYDLEVKRSKEKLAAKLDGLNGNEVIAKVRWRRPQPDKGKVAEGAADSTIDT